MHTYIRHICAPVHVQVLRSTVQNLRHYILGGCDALVCCFSLQRAKEGRLLLNEVVGGMVMWFRTLAESVVGIKIDHGVTLEGPVPGVSPGSVEGVSLSFFLLWVKLSESGRSGESRCPGKNLENITTIFKDLMKDSLEFFYIFCTCCFTSFLTSFYLPYSTRVDQHDAKKSMFYETSPLPPCMAQEFAMLYDTLWHIQGRSCRAQGRSCRGQGRSCRGQGRSCRQYRHTYIRHI